MKRLIITALLLASPTFAAASTRIARIVNRAWIETVKAPPTKPTNLRVQQAAHVPW